MKNLFENFGSKKFNTKNLKLMLKRAYEKYQSANSSFWVTSLSFYTILAIVPILAILVSLSSWFGAEDYIINQIKDIAPLKGGTLELLTDFSNNLLMDARSNVLAGVGFLFLGWTFIQMFSLIEASFNEIWHIKKSRSLIRKISDYISFFIFLPLIFIILNGLILFLYNKEHFPFDKYDNFLYGSLSSYAKHNGKNYSCFYSISNSFNSFFTISIYFYFIAIFVNRL